MKVLLVNGQNHKGSTYQIGRMLADQLTDRDAVKEVFLPRDMPEFCCGCTLCFMKDEKLCPHFQYTEPITRLIDEADVLIFTTPVYVYHATGSMKALLDHYGFRWMIHRPEESMFHKQAVCISTAAGGGMKSACRDMKDSFFFWGIGRIYSYGVAVAAVSWDGVKKEKKTAIEKKVETIRKKIMRHHGKPHASLKTRGFFYLMRFLQRRDWNQVDKEYWQEKGWDKKKRPWRDRSQV